MVQGLDSESLDSELLDSNNLDSEHLDSEHLESEYEWKEYIESILGIVCTKWNRFSKLPQRSRSNDDVRRFQRLKCSENVTENLVKSEITIKVMETT